MVIDIWKDTDKIVEDLPSERSSHIQIRESISCLAATISAATVSCRMCADRERSRNPKDHWPGDRESSLQKVVEVMLGQNVNSYGKMLEETDDICTAQEIENEGLERIRL